MLGRHRIDRYHNCGESRGGCMVERDEAAFAAGCEAARADIAACRLIYRWSGHAGHWGHWIATQFSERFGVRVEGLGICFVTTASISFNDGYNSVLAGEVDRHHGPDALKSVLNEAKRQSEIALWDARQTWLDRNGET
jgi:hypothetical protein